MVEGMSLNQLLMDAQNGLVQMIEELDPTRKRLERLAAEPWVWEQTEGVQVEGKKVQIKHEQLFCVWRMVGSSCETKKY